MSIAALDAVEVDYPGRGKALGPFSLSLEPGETVALIGPSGSSDRLNGPSALPRPG